jgi:Ca2+-binding RTX toxin-like protein
MSIQDHTRFHFSTSRTPGLNSAALAFVALPTSAYAGTVEVAGDVHVRYTAAPGERNDVTVSADAGVITLVDAGAPTVAGQGCAGGGIAGTPVSCSLPAPFVFVALQLGDEADTADTTGLDPASGVGVRLEAGRGADTMRGGEGADTVLPGKGADRVLGGGGNDSWAQYGGRPDGGDYFDGGAGHDLAEYDTRYRLRLEIDGRPNDGDRRERDNIKGVESGFVGSKDDVIAGNPRDQLLRDGAGNGVVRGRGGADRLFGGHGDDRGSGGRGDDFIEGGPGRDVLLAGVGDDLINAKKGTLSDPSGHDHVDCGPGEDAVVINQGDRIRRCETVNGTRRRSSVWDDKR